MKIRRTNLTEATPITTLAVSSKAVWGYDENFMRQCCEELTVSEAYISSNEVYVLAQDGEAYGFYGMTVLTGSIPCRVLPKKRYVL